MRRAAFFAEPAINKTALRGAFWAKRVQGAPNRERSGRERRPLLFVRAARSSARLAPERFQPAFFSGRSSEGVFALNCQNLQAAKGLR